MRTITTLIAALCSLIAATGCRTQCIDSGTPNWLTITVEHTHEAGEYLYTLTSEGESFTCGFTWPDTECDGGDAELVFGTTGLERITVSQWPQTGPTLAVTRDGAVLFDGTVELDSVDVYRKRQKDCGEDNWRAGGTASF